MFLTIYFLKNIEQSSQIKKLAGSSLKKSAPYQWLFGVNIVEINVASNVET